MSTPSKSIAKVISTLRENAGMTAKELAEKSSLSPALISRIESDDYTTLSLTTVKSLSEGFGITLSHLLTELGLISANQSRPSFQMIAQSLRSNGYTEKEAQDVIRYARYVKNQRRDK